MKLDADAVLQVCMHAHRWLLVLATAIGPAMALTPMPLVGTTWAWHPASGDGAALPSERYTVELRPDGSLVVRADCNRGKGRYQHDGDRLSFGPVAITKMGCPPPSRGEEFAQRLSSVDGYRFDGLDLVLTSSRGDLRFRPLDK